MSVGNAMFHIPSFGDLPVPTGKFKTLEMFCDRNPFIAQNVFNYKILFLTDQYFLTSCTTCTLVKCPTNTELDQQQEEMNVNVNMTINPKLTEGIRVMPSASKTALDSFDLWVSH